MILSFDSNKQNTRCLIIMAIKAKIKISVGKANSDKYKVIVYIISHNIVLKKLCNKLIEMRSQIVKIQDN